MVSGVYFSIRHCLYRWFKQNPDYACKLQFKAKCWFECQVNSKKHNSWGVPDCKPVSTGLKDFGVIYFFQCPNWKRKKVTIFFCVFSYSKCLPRVSIIDGMKLLKTEPCCAPCLVPIRRLSRSSRSMHSVTYPRRTTDRRLDHLNLNLFEKFTRSTEIIYK